MWRSSQPYRGDVPTVLTLYSDVLVPLERALEGVCALDLLARSLYGILDRPGRTQVKKKNIVCEWIVSTRSTCLRARGCRRKKEPAADHQAQLNAVELRKPQ